MYIYIYINTYIYIYIYIYFFFWGGGEAGLFLEGPPLNFLRAYEGYKAWA